MISSILKRIAYEADFFKTVFHFNFSKGQQKFSTKMGTFLTLAILAVLIFSLTQSDIIQKKSPSVISQIIPKVSPPPIALSKGNFNISFIITDENLISETIDPQILDVQIIGFEYNENMSPVPNMINFLNLHTCTSNEIADSFASMNIATCLDMQDFQIEGGVFDVFSSEIRIELNICNNITSNNTCKTVEEIEAYLQEGKYFGVYYNDYYVDIQNYENPIQKFPRLEKMILSPLSQYMGELYLRKGEMVQDDGVILSSLTQFNYFTRDELITSSASRASIDDPSPLVQLWIFSAGDMEKINRTYQSLPDVLAKLSGIANLLIIVGFLFMNIYNKIMGSVYLVNKLFKSHLKERIQAERKKGSLTIHSKAFQGKVPEKKINDPSFNAHINFAYIQPKKIEESEKELNDFQEKKLDESKKDLNEIQMKKIDESEKNSNIAINSPSPQKKKDKIRKKLKIELEKDEKLTFSDYISMKIKILFSCKLSDKQKLYRDAENELNKKMNVKCIVKQLHDVECLKDTLFSPMQNLIFDSIPKPVNLLKKYEENPRNKKERTKLSERKLNATRISTFLNSYETEGRKSEIDDRLIQHLTQINLIN